MYTYPLSIFHSKVIHLTNPIKRVQNEAHIRWATPYTFWLKMVKI